MDFRNARLWFLMALFLAIYPINGMSYEVPTHAYISGLSINRSILSGNDTVLKDINIGENDTFWSGLEYSFYRENSAQGAREYANYRGLISAGARHEDEVDDVPGGDTALFGGKRAANHFFDPQTDRPLQNQGENFRSPDWAIEDRRRDLIYRTSAGDVEQKFSFNDGVEYLYSALTLSEKTERDDNFGRAFRSLGHSIHHIQDMAQPQHARLDDHCHSDEVIGRVLLNPAVFPLRCQQGHNPSLYESYSRSVQGTFGRFSDIYPVPRFSTAREFYVGNGKGISEFTSYNFVSEGTNFKMMEDGFAVIHNFRNDESQVGYGLNFPAPPLSGDRYEIDSSSLPPAADGTTYNLGGTVIFYGSPVSDRNISSQSRYNQKSTTLSLYSWDVDSEGQSTALADFTQNKYTIDAAHEFLIPRAIAYSAGLIDYFFRLRLKVENIQTTSSTLSFDVRNQSRLGALGSLHRFTIDSGSEFVALYDSVSGQRRQLNIIDSNFTSTGNSDLVITSDIEYDQIISIKAEIPNDVDWAKDKPFTLVVRGSLTSNDPSGGSEVGVGGVSFGLDEGLFYAVAGGSGYLLSFEEGRWIAKQTNNDYKVGNVNWRGHYENGKPTKQLSWMGATGRYFQPVRNPGDTGAIVRLPEVYMDGRILAVTPSPVVGASIDMQNRLIVIGQDDIVYRTEIDQISDPLNVEWETLGSLNIPYSTLATINDVGARPDWFFNGDGDRAVTVRKSEAWSLSRMMVEYYPYNYPYWSLYAPSRMYIARVGGGVSVEEGDENLITMSPSSYSGSMIFAADYLDNRLVTGSISVSHNDTLPRIVTCPSNPSAPGCTQFPVSGSISHTWTYHIPGASADFFRRVIDVYAASATNILDITHFVWEDVLLHCDLRYGVMIAFQARQIPGAPSPGIQTNAVEVTENSRVSIKLTNSAFSYGQGKQFYIFQPEGTVPMTYPDLRSTSVSYRGHRITAAVGSAGEVATTVAPYNYAAPVTYLTGNSDLLEIIGNPSAFDGFMLVRPLN